MDPLSALDHLEDYRRLFTDVNLWAPYARRVCERHGLGPIESVRTGVPGTYPAFIVGERWVVKFFGRLFNGWQSFQVEREASRLAAADPAVTIARVAASGELGGPGWPWPYLVFEYIPARSLGEQIAQVDRTGLLRVAAEMGEMARRLHALPIEGSPVIPQDHAAYLAFLTDRRANCLRDHLAWGTLPAHLAAQIEQFLPPVEALVDRTRPAHLIHGDLTRDHLLGRAENGSWSTLALIDFGDAMTGDLLYELVALHLDLFGGDRELLTAFLDAYGVSAAWRAELPRKALATSLLHNFNVLACLPAEALQAESLEALARTLWDI